MGRRLRLIAVLVLGGCAHRQVGPDGVPLWFEVRTPHFTVRAATDARTAGAAGLQLEQIRAALLEGSWHARDEPPGTVQVVLVDRAERTTYLPTGLAGYTTRNSLGQLLVVASAEEDVRQLRILKHELAHANADQFLLRSPFWMQEGLAIYLETLQLSETTATIGKAIPEFVG